jgi:uncharacterized membrane protein YvbJ
MAFCGKCGAQLHENATFCANCGTPTSVSAQASAGGAPVVPQPPMGARTPSSQGFFASLFDFSFSSFVTGKLIKLLYVLAMILVAVATVIVVVQLQNQPNPIPLVSIIAAPIVFFLYLILIRVQLEILIVVFRMYEHVAEIAEQIKRR